MARVLRRDGEVAPVQVEFGLPADERGAPLPFDDLLEGEAAGTGRRHGASLSAPGPVRQPLPPTARDGQHLARGQNGLRQREPYGDLPGGLVRRHLPGPFSTTLACPPGGTRASGTPPLVALAFVVAPLT